MTVPVITEEATTAETPQEIKRVIARLAITNETREALPSNASSDLFLAIAETELAKLPAITRLDEYMHFRLQLEQMRARHIEFNPARFGLEMAVLTILTEYEESLGLPVRAMPKPDGNGGVMPEAVVPEGWSKIEN